MIRTISHDLKSFEEVFNTLFNPANRVVEPTPLHIAIDVIEQESALILRAAMPGVPESELNLTVEENVLTISGDSTIEASQEGEKVYRREISRGKFARSIRLPEGLNLDAIIARYENGIVAITIPKVEAPQPRVRTIALNSIVNSQSEVTQAPTQG